MAREPSHDFHDARRAPKEQARYTDLCALETTESELQLELRTCPLASSAERGARPLGHVEGGLPIACGNDRRRAVLSRGWMALIVFRSVVGRPRSRATIAIRKVCQSLRSPVAWGARRPRSRRYLYNPAGREGVGGQGARRRGVPRLRGPHTQPRNGKASIRVRMVCHPRAMEPNRMQELVKCAHSSASPSSSGLQTPTRVAAESQTGANVVGVDAPDWMGSAVLSAPTRPPAATSFWPTNSLAAPEPGRALFGSGSPV